ncbi:MAG: ATP synthase F1 subunit delta [Bythopirellula sp.]|nr:ATP synthase F1 subunit delta [Bythopirellula sp.]
MSDATSQHSARETVFDVDVEKLARVYAQAGLNAAGDPEAQGRFMEELNDVVLDVLTKFPDLEKVFGSALVSNDDKLGILDRVFGKNLSASALNFIKVIAEHGRLGVLRQIIRSANALWQVRRNQVSVKLELAHPVDAALQQEMIALLGKRLEAEPLVTVTINPDLIAGFVVRSGDRVLDASTRTNLERARQGMIARAVEAIQQHPDKIFQQNES